MARRVTVLSQDKSSRGISRRASLLRSYALKLFIHTPIVLLIMVTISYALVRMAPGGPFDGDRNIPEATRAALNEHYGLDQPILTQYFRFIGGVIQGDLGPSMTRRGDTVNNIIATHLPTSLLLGGISLILALVIGVSAGVFAALKQNSFRDHGFMTAIMLGVSIPAFVIGPMLQWFAVRWTNIPIAGYDGFNQPELLLLPALTLAAPFAARIAGLTRAGMLDVIGEDFIRTAKAKGLHPFHIITGHAMRGALLPVVAFLGPAVASIMTGSLVVEQIFAIPGLGKEFIQSAFNRDYFLSLGTVIVYGTLIIFCNLGADLIHRLMDPRIRHV